MTPNLPQAFDQALFFLINRTWQNPLFDGIMPVISTLEYFYIPLGIAWLLLMLKGRLKTRVAMVSLLLVIGAAEFVSSDVLKPTFNRPRPYHQLSEVHYFDRTPRTWQITPELSAPILGKSQSLPSSHATNIFAAAGFLSFFFRRYWPFFYLIALLVGYSRVYLGVHFPLDVAAGALTGTVCACIFAALSMKIIHRIERGRSAPGSRPVAPKP